MRTRVEEKTLTRTRTKLVIENVMNEEAVERGGERKEIAIGHDVVVVALGGAKEAGAEVEVVAFLATGVEGMNRQVVIGTIDAAGGRVVAAGVMTVREIEIVGVDAANVIQRGRRGGIAAIEKVEIKIVEGAAWISKTPQTRDLIRHKKKN